MHFRLLTFLASIAKHEGLLLASLESQSCVDSVQPVLWKWAWSDHPLNNSLSKPLLGFRIFIVEDDTAM